MNLAENNRVEIHKCDTTTSTAAGTAAQFSVIICVLEMQMRLVVHGLLKRTLMKAILDNRICVCRLTPNGRRFSSFFFVADGESATH